MKKKFFKVEITLKMSQNLSQEKLNYYLLIAIEELESGKMKSLIEKKADVNYENDYGDTPLNMAIANGCESYVKFLVEKGADVNHQDKRKQAPLMYAILMGDHKLCNFLIDNGAHVQFLKEEVNVCDNDGVIFLKKLHKKINQY